MTTFPLAQSQNSLAQRPLRHRLWWAAGIVAGLFLSGIAAVSIKPAPFPPLTPSTATIPTAALPAGLPAPVARYFRQLYGNQVPVIRTAVITGRGTMRIPQLFNLTLPVRFRFVHETGRNYRHYIEVTLFGQPVLKVNEYFVDGKERQELPWAVATDNPKLDQGGNLGMWAETIQWMPAVLITDPNVRWEAVDDTTALLVVPFGEAEERFVVRFSERTGEIVYWEVMRYAGGVGDKTLWVNGMWFEDGKLWFVVGEEFVTVNVTVDTSLTAKGQ
jgi:hypothetical protein